MKNAFGPWFRAFTWMALGGLLILAVPPVLDDAAAPGVPGVWWASRAFGLLAYVALWLSMLFGVFVGSRGAGGLLDRATTLQLHSRWAVTGLGTTAIHVLLVVASEHSAIPPAAALVPFASPTLTGPVTVGTLALWGLVVIAASTHFFDKLPHWAWRAIHASSFGAFLLAATHAVTAGTDTESLGARALYLSTAAALLAAIIQRVLLGLAARGRSNGATT